MKITFIYDYKDGEAWSTPMALLNEFKERGWETQIIKTNDTDLKNWVDSKPQTDIVLFAPLIVLLVTVAVFDGVKTLLGAIILVNVVIIEILS